MATSTVNRTTSWCSLHSPTFSSPSLCSSVPHSSKSEACGDNQQSFCNLSTLHEIPTRNFRRDPPDAVIDHLDDGVDATNNPSLPPTTLEGTTATFSYQSELAAITAAIDRMRQRAPDKPADDATRNSTVVPRSFCSDRYDRTCPADSQAVDHDSHPHHA